MSAGCRYFKRNAILRGCVFIGDVSTWMYLAVMMLSEAPKFYSFTSFSVFHSSGSKLSLEDLLLSSSELPAPSVVTELLSLHLPFFLPS